MANYRYFWDLKGSQAYSNHIVSQFDVNTPNSGGGVFKWVNANNTSIQDIPGYRIKPTSTTLGYWIREAEGKPFNVDWAGNINTPSQLTLSGYGLTAGDITTRYGYINSVGTGSNVVTLSDTYDTAAVKVALNMMHLGLFYAVEFKPALYFINSTCWLPRKTDANRQSALGLDLRSNFYINGNGCSIIPHSTAPANALTVFDRYIANQTDAVGGGTIYGQVACRFHIENFTFQSSRGGRAIHLSATYGSIINNIVIRGFDYGVWTRFGLRNTLTNIETVLVNKVGVYIDSGSTSSGTVDYPGGWSGADINLANSQSNSASLHFFRAWSQGTPDLTHIRINGCSGVVLNEIIMEGNNSGTTPPQYGIFFDNRGSGPVKDLTIKRLHLEVQNGVSQYQYSAIFVRGSNGTQITIDGLFSQYDTNVIDSYDTSGNMNIIIRDIVNITSNSTFGANVLGTSWLFENCRTFNPQDPARWLTTNGTYADHAGNVISYARVLPNFRAWSPIIGGGNGVRVCYPFNVQ